MSFVVVHPACVHRAIAQRRLVWRRLPQIERYRRLDVVMLDADERALPRTGLGHDEGRRAVGPELARVAKSSRAQPIAAPAGGGIERGAIRGLTRDRAKVTQLLDEALALPANEAVEGISGHEVEYGSARPARQYAHDASRTRQRLATNRSEEHTSELQSHSDLVCRLLLEKKK